MTSNLGEPNCVDKGVWEISYYFDHMITVYHDPDSEYNRDIQEYLVDIDGILLITENSDGTREEWRQYVLSLGENYRGISFIVCDKKTQKAYQEWQAEQILLK